MVFRSNITEQITVINPTISEQLAQALQLTNDMFEQAEHGNWEQLTELDRQRSSLFHTVFPLADSDNTAEHRSRLEQLISANEQLQKCCQQARSQLELKMANMHKHKHAAAAYVAR